MKKIYLASALIFIIVFGFYVGIKISETRRMNYIKYKVNKAVESAINGFYPKCKVVDKIDKEYKYKITTGSYDAENLNRYGFIKARDLGEYNEITYCDFISNIQVYSKDKTYDYKECEATYNVKLNCSKSFEDVFNKEKKETDALINKALKK